MQTTNRSIKKYKKIRTKHKIRIEFQREIVSRRLHISKAHDHLSATEEHPRARDYGEES